MRARWPWLAALVLLFLGGAAGGWALSSSHDTGAGTPRPAARRPGRLDSRLRRVETEVTRARGGEQTGIQPSLDGQRAGALAGVTIAIDPGHNGGNATHPEEIGRPVPAGVSGTTKPCNTTGTETNDGNLTEAQLNFDVARILAAQLKSLDATVVMTRTSNDGVGPCVNERAEIGNRADADVAISIHADGNESPGAHGFDVIYPATTEMVAPAIAESDRHLAIQIRNSLTSAGIPPANYIGKNGLDRRDDLAGLNLSTQPIALVELGNMRSAAEAAKLESHAYRVRLAEALSSGLRRFIGTG